jgi:hypothetical protein
MKKKLLFLLFPLFSITQAQTIYNSSCIPTGNEQNLYWQDAYLLATKRVNDIGSSWKDSATIPLIYVDSIEKALFAIQNMQSVPIQDTILSLFGYDHFVYGDDSLHIYSAGGDGHYAYSVKSINVTVYNNSGWAASWALGNYNNTNNDTVNYLVNSFGLQIALNSLQIYNDRTMYVISGYSAMNTPALVQKFAALSGVYTANITGPVGTGKFISIDSINNGDIYLTYNYGCGDCLSGCTYGREWKFKVSTSTDCSVTYLSEDNWGNSLEWNTQGSCFDALVPVEFTGIQAFQTNNYSTVKWQVAGETGIAEYIVERSENGIDFRPVGEVIAKNSSSLPGTYSWLDKDAISMKEYYKIKSVGTNGTLKYSSVANLQLDVNAFTLVYPTLLNNNKLTVQFNKADISIYEIGLTNIEGQKLFSQQIQATATIFTKQLLLPANLSKGVYILSIQNKNTFFKQPVVVQ